MLRTFHRSNSVDLAYLSLVCIVGDYPENERGQQLYPRRYFWEQITGVLSTSPRRGAIPIFTDKHLAATWEDAAWIYRRGKDLGLVHMAGSSVPCCFWRDPFLEYPVETDFEDVLMISYGGIEAYGYHGLETLLCNVERRRGGEAGVVSVQCLEGEAVWEAAEAGKWSIELAVAACNKVDLVKN